MFMHVALAIFAFLPAASHSQPSALRSAVSGGAPAAQIFSLVRCSDEDEETHRDKRYDPPATTKSRSKDDDHAHDEAHDRELPANRARNGKTPY